MANEIIPNEGLDFWLNIMLKGGTAPGTLYVGLFTGQTATTTPAATAVLSTSTGVSEANFAGYARQSIATAEWGNPATLSAGDVTSGRGVQGPQKSFPAATSPYATAINGFFLATAATAGVAVLYANFDDNTGIASLALGDIIKVTPRYVLGG